jgi:hypothetical protein
MFVLCCEKTVVDRDMKGRKRINTEQKWIKGETQELVKKKKKKSRRGHGCLYCVCCKDGSMEHKVT